MRFEIQLTYNIILALRGCRFEEPASRGRAPDVDADHVNKSMGILKLDMNPKWEWVPKKANAIL